MTASNLDLVTGVFVLVRKVILRTYGKNKEACSGRKEGAVVLRGGGRGFGMKMDMNISFALIECLFIGRWFLLQICLLIMP